LRGHRCKRRARRAAAAADDAGRPPQRHVARRAAFGIASDPMTTGQWLPGRETVTVYRVVCWY